MATRLHIMLFVIILAYICNTNAISSKRGKCPRYCDCYVFGIYRAVDCSLGNFSSIPYQRLSNTTNVLIMNNNQLKELEPFPPNTKIQRLQLSENIIPKISKSTFAELHYLMDVDLSSNLINHIDPEAFKNNVGFTTLDLQGNSFEQVTGPFLYSRSLLYLQLRNCHLTKLSPQFFVNINRLQKLDLSSNSLQFISPGIFDPLKQLKLLKLNNCNITYISSIAFDKLKYLTVLELAGNSLKNHVDWEMVLGNLGRLEIFNLRNSEVSNLPDNVFFYNINLKELFLAGNNLSNLNLATTIGYNLINLNLLDLSYCQLKGPLPKDAFAVVTDLRTLRLSGNNLATTDLAATLRPLSRLVTLILRDCELTKFPINFIEKFTYLQLLDLSNNLFHNAHKLILATSTKAVIV